MREYRTTRRPYNVVGAKCGRAEFVLGLVRRADMALTLRTRGRRVILTVDSQRILGRAMRMVASLSNASSTPTPVRSPLVESPGHLPDSSAVTSC
jgi:hypothetical protein